MKKKVYIISHSHWDREWYMPYEQHHMRLVELMDDLLELFKTDPDFKSFHLDGQTIILDDYLQVRPEKKAEVQQAITEGKLRIGPFYILQDDFLISSESNVRNMLIGKKESEKWGVPVKLGYFPDTFGNMGQTPQMMKQAGLEVAAFGRGVKPVGFDNQVLADENYTSQFSEMMWRGPDGSEILGLLFANWYSNGNEIPTTTKEAQEFWRQKLAEAEAFASTNHLLMMNGVDHQPVQKDVAKAIALANELFPECEFIHSNFDDYLAAVREDLPADVGVVQGELTSQETDGWFTLANTASSRVYLKQWNTKVQRQLENITEPLAAMVYAHTKNYPHDQLDYAWKLLLQNHPHDSICGCSVDEVHREMMPRFEKAYEVGNFLASEALEQLVATIDTHTFPQESYPFVVVNTSGFTKTGTVTVSVEIARRLFKEGHPHELWQELTDMETPCFQVIDEQGNRQEAQLSEPQVRFSYDLPKDRFRIPYMAKYIDVTLPVSRQAPLSWQTFALSPSDNLSRIEETLLHKNQSGYQLENAFLHVSVNENGTLAVLDKGTGESYQDLMVFEDVGDIANEYIFKQPEKTTVLLSSQQPAEVSVVLDEPFMAKLKITQQMEIPVSADERLLKEQEAVVDFRFRKAGRAQQVKIMQIDTIVTMEKESARLQFETTIDNQCKDHRVRVLFPTNIQAQTHEADSIFEVVERPNQASKSWENPTNPQHQHAFVNVHDQYHGVTVSNTGLNEYELLPKNATLALTLFRSVGELGDWGYFPTPEAQCLGSHQFTYGIEFHGACEGRYQTYQHAYAAQIPFSVKQTPVHGGIQAPSASYLTIEGETFALTAMKNSDDDRHLVVRGFNMADYETHITISDGTNEEPVLLNLLEEVQEGESSDRLAAYEIRTLGVKR